jgi:hypothetical protein
MPEHITVQPHVSTDDLERRYRGAHGQRERAWRLILWLLSHRQTAWQVAQSTGYSPYEIGQRAKLRAQVFDRDATLRCISQPAQSWAPEAALAWLASPS